MELIDKLEVTRRGPYSGGFGGISFTGDMDIALALRTIVFPTASRFDTMYSYRDSNKRRDWVAHLQAGAGIVIVILVMNRENVRTKLQPLPVLLILLSRHLLTNET